MESAQSASRPLKPEDLDRVVDIDRRITGRPRRKFFEKRLEAALADGAGFIATAVESAGELTGFAIARVQNGEYGDARRAATVDVIGVDPDCQQRGQGTLLLEAVTDVAEKLSIQELRTQVGWTEPSLLHFFAVEGFVLAPRQVLERTTTEELMEEELDAGLDDDVMAPRLDAGIPDFSDPLGADPAALQRDHMPIRSLTPQDLEAIVRIDRKLTGRDRSDFYEAKHREVMSEAGIRVSLVAEVDGRPAGYIMARVDYGEFGMAEPAAVMDTIGVDPGLAKGGIGSALLSQLLLNLKGINVETLRTTMRWDAFPLLSFAAKAGFAPSQRLVLAKTLA